jgi:hypothetical protein
MAKRPCQHCGKECAEWERTSEGTYLHTSCASALAATEGWTLPDRLLGSRAEPEEDPDGV